jgi:hypothetical protein
MPELVRDSHPRAAVALEECGIRSRGEANDRLPSGCAALCPSHSARFQDLEVSVLKEEIEKLQNRSHGDSAIQGDAEVFADGRREPR